MAQYVSLDHLRFILYEVLDAVSLCELERFKEYDKEAFDILIDSVKSYADQVLYPSFSEMDQQAARFEDGKIIVHPVVGQLMKDSGDNGWIGLNFDFDEGGMQLPLTISNAVAHISECANNHLTGYPALTAGSAHLILNFGSEELKAKYVPNMMSGKWGGTMCLTEPQAGSSLSDVSTSATLNEDGSYAIKGQKIFISGGDHEYVDNVIHLVLARIDGAPKGTKGISLFVVPKYNVVEGGESVGSNDVTTAGDFQKMGQKGYCTAHLIFGEKDNCKGWLVGEENKGLKYMFQMMNGARIDVGLTAASVATAAYYASLEYAKERPQGRRIKSGGQKNVSEEQTLIINHPDVRRMLLLQKAITEAAVALLFQVSLYSDLAQAGPEEEREKYHDLLELLTPIAKTYPSEMGRESINNGLQVLGGYGFCKDFPLEQYYRDIRIMSLYEGTTGIQSLDLLGRKIVMKNGVALQYLKSEIEETVKEASKYNELKQYCTELEEAGKDLQEVLMHLMQFAMKGEHERFLADASIFMEFMSTIIIAWQWLKMATQAKEAIVTGNKQFEEQFYENKVLTMRFFFKYELSKIEGLKKTLMHPDCFTIVEEYEKAFS